MDVIYMKLSDSVNLEFYSKMNIVEVSEQTVNATTVSTGADLTVSRSSSN